MQNLHILTMSWALEIHIDWCFFDFPPGLTRSYRYPALFWLRCRGKTAFAWAKERGKTNVLGILSPVPRHLEEVKPSPFVRFDGLFWKSQPVVMTWVGLWRDFLFPR